MTAAATTLFREEVLQPGQQYTAVRSLSHSVSTTDLLAQADAHRPRGIIAMNAAVQSYAPVQLETRRQGDKFPKALASAPVAVIPAVESDVSLETSAGLTIAESESTPAQVDSSRVDTTTKEETPLPKDRSPTITAMPSLDHLLAVVSGRKPSQPANPQEEDTPVRTTHSSVHAASTIAEAPLSSARTGSANLNKHAVGAPERGQPASVTRTPTITALIHSAQTTPPPLALSPAQLTTISDTLAAAQMLLRNLVRVTAATVGRTPPPPEGSRTTPADVSPGAAGASSRVQRANEGETATSASQHVAQGTPPAKPAYVSQACQGYASQLESHPSSLPQGATHASTHAASVTHSSDLGEAYRLHEQRVHASSALGRALAPSDLSVTTDRSNGMPAVARRLDSVRRPPNTHGEEALQANVVRGHAPLPRVARSFLPHTTTSFAESARSLRSVESGEHTGPSDSQREETYHEANGAATYSHYAATPQRTSTTEIPYTSPTPGNSTSVAALYDSLAELDKGLHSVAARLTTLASQRKATQAVSSPTQYSTRAQPLSLTRASARQQQDGTLAGMTGGAEAATHDEYRRTAAALFTTTPMDVTTFSVSSARSVHHDGVDEYQDQAAPPLAPLRRHDSANECHQRAQQASLNESMSTADTASIASFDTGGEVEEERRHRRRKSRVMRGRGVQPMAGTASQAGVADTSSGLFTDDRIVYELARQSGWRPGVVRVWSHANSEERSLELRLQGEGGSTLLYDAPISAVIFHQVPATPTELLLMDRSVEVPRRYGIRIDGLLLPGLMALHPKPRELEAGLEGVGVRLTPF